MMLLAPVTNWEPHGVTLAGYCYTIRHGMKVQTVTPYRVSQLQLTALRYAVTLQVCTHLYPLCCVKLQAGFAVEVRVPFIAIATGLTPRSAEPHTKWGSGAAVEA
jgi:hypothetical protein